MYRKKLNMFVFDVLVLVVTYIYSYMVVSAESGMYIYAESSKRNDHI